MDIIGVGLIGTGYMGKCHALAWTGVRAVFGDSPVVRRVALCEVDQGLARNRAEEFGFETATADWRAVVADPAVDVVSITTPTDLHAPMAIAALEAGKHVWCEKPMAPALSDAEHMAAAARASGKIAILGYNYIQSPAIRYIAKHLKRGAIGPVAQFRVEMDEDLMADPEAPFTWRSDASSGYGALNDFAVHPMSLIATLIGSPSEVFGEMVKPYADRPDGTRRRSVETFDVATALLRMASGASGMIQVSRSAWGRKGRMQLQIFGARGAIFFDQERFNEVGVYLADGPVEDQGIKTVLMGPAHPPYERFIPAPGHQMGFNDLKIIEAHELLNRIAGRPALTIDFEAGLAIERTIHAIARSSREGRWIATRG
ncbi:MAG TPA: Gfo/Idh/MocA family oxidoreductase [Roseiarcus sp.]|nr:Gfo/Idh/MocA family oxidoreductase [Roseiarcus sp.]